ncbi:hypothetical protein BS17DRAFT_704079, partial [Gyrodon lividus]
VRRDVASSGIQGQQLVIRWVTDNSGPWFLHCHIDWHLDAGFAIVMAEDPAGAHNHLSKVPSTYTQSPATFATDPIFRSMGEPLPDLQFVNRVTARRRKLLGESC